MVPDKTAPSFVVGLNCISNIHLNISVDSKTDDMSCDRRLEI